MNSEAVPKTSNMSPKSLRIKHQKINASKKGGRRHWRKPLDLLSGRAGKQTALHCMLEVKMEVTGSMCEAPHPYTK
jgi:hypothetical protein